MSQPRDVDLARDLEKAYPKGIDIHFENVGGRVSEAVLSVLKDSTGSRSLNYRVFLGP